MNFDDLNIKVVDLRAKDRWEAIEELMGHLVADGNIPAQHRESIAQRVRKRESAMTTGIGFGVAIPHASTELLPEVVTMAGRSRAGIQFEALDGQPVHLVFLFLVPAGEFQKHLNVLTNIAKLIHKRKFRDGLWGRFM